MDNNGRRYEATYHYSLDHYFRIYVRIRNGVSYANDSMNQLCVIKPGESVGMQKTSKEIGPMWMGNLQNRGVIEYLRNVHLKKS